LIDLGVKFDIVEKSGSWYSYDSNRIGQGKENARNFLKENPDVADAIEAKIRQKASAPVVKAGAVKAGVIADDVVSEEKENATEVAF
jgi:recombination protein RecA